MKLDEFHAKWRSKYIRSPAEDAFITEVFYPLLGEIGLDLIEPAYEFQDETGNTYILDYVIFTEYQNYDLEINGRSYHDIYSVSAERYNELIERKSRLQDNLIANFKILEFTADEIRENPQRAINQLRRGIRADPGLNPFFLQKQMNAAQIECYKQILEKYFDLKKKYAILSLPMGMGKTFLATQVAIALKDSFQTSGVHLRILYVAHKNLIIEQAHEAFEEIFEGTEFTFGYYNSSKKTKSADFIFATFQTLYQNNNFLEFQPNEFTFIIIDEFHHTLADSFSQVFYHFSGAMFYLGLTATPYRSDNKDLLKLFEYSPPIIYSFERGIQEGYLTPIKYIILDDNIDYSEIENNGIRYFKSDLDKKLLIEARDQAILHEYIERAGGKRTIGFCVSREHTDRMKALFNENGIPSENIIASTTDKDRKEIINKLKANQILVIFTIEIFNEGIDIPEIEALMFLRPTDSKLVLVQQLGRGLRIAAKKEEVIVLDFVGRNQLLNSFTNIFHFKKEKIDELERKIRDSRDAFIVEKTEIGEVHFTLQSLETFKRILEKSEGINPQDLIDNYYVVKEKNKDLIPTKSIMDEESISKYKFIEYEKAFGSWNRFLKLIEEIALTTDELYPQAMHPFYLFYIIKTLGDNQELPEITERPLRHQDFYGSGREINRQTRYRLRFLMGIGLIEKDLSELNEEEQKNKYRTLTLEGKEFYRILKQNEGLFPADFWEIDITDSANSSFNWKAKKSDEYFYSFIENDIRNSASELYEYLRKFFLQNVIPIKQLIIYLFHIRRMKSFTLDELYHSIYIQSFVVEYNASMHIKMNSFEEARRRYAFPLRMLVCFDIIEKSGRNFQIKNCPLISYNFLNLFEIDWHSDEEDEIGELAESRMRIIKEFYDKYKTKPDLFINYLDTDEKNQLYEDLKELFGISICTPRIFFENLMTI